MKTNYLIIISFFIAVLIGSCSPKIGANMGGNSILYPEDVDTARIQYLTSISSNVDLMGKQSAFKTSIVGEQEVSVISKPYGVQIKDGKIYVCDVTFRSLDVIDLEKKNLSFFAPTGLKRFHLPLTSFIDEDGTQYIADPYKKLVHVYDSELKFVKEIGKDVLIGPTGVSVKGGKIYVVDSKNNRVNIFDKNTGALIDYFPKNTTAGNEDWLYTPSNIEISDTRIYITDMGATKVKVYSMDGKHLLSIGQLGNLMGQFVRPKGLAVDKEENIYVVDGAFENVQIFNKEGKLLMWFGAAYSGPGDMWLPTDVDIDYDNLQYFQQYVDPRYELKYLILVANQFGPDKINVYGRVDMK